MNSEKERQLRALTKRWREEDARMSSAILRVCAEQVDEILDDTATTNAEEVADAAAGEK